MPSDYEKNSHALPQSTSMDFSPRLSTRISCAARGDDNQPCGRLACLPCPECLLVAYCGKGCREAAWSIHHNECIGEKNSDELEQLRANVGKAHGIHPGRKATHQSFWAKYAATDILSVDKNEGINYDGVLRLLFTGEFGLRHLIYSVVSLPAEAKPSLEVHISEHGKTEHLARTFYALLILRDAVSDPYLNAEAVIHLWYSAKIPAALFEHIRRLVYDELQSKNQAVEDYYERHNNADYLACTTRWKDGPIDLQVDMNRIEWKAMLARLEPTADLGPSEIAGLRTLDVAKNGESFHRINARMTPARSLGLKRWRQDGLLLPYGHPRDAFDTINPIFFQKDCSYPAGATSEPLSEWPMELLDFKDLPAQNDVYGKMFFYLRKLLVDFQIAVRRSRMGVHLHSESIEQLTGIIQSRVGWNISFDRIEAGSHWDLSPMLTLTSFTQLLRHVDENPFATLLTMSRDSVTHPTDSVEKVLKEEKALLFEDSKCSLDQYIAPVKRDQQSRLQDIVRRQIGLLMWRNWDRFSEHYFQYSDMFKFNSTSPPRKKSTYPSVFPSGFLGLTPKAKNTITRRWPNRLIHGRNTTTSLREINRWIGWVDNRPERWLEWRNMEDIPSNVWLEWASFVVRKEKLRLQNRCMMRADDTSTECEDTENGADTDDDNSADETATPDMAVEGNAQVSSSLTAGKETDNECDAHFANKDSEIENNGEDSKAKKNKRKKKKKNGGK